VLMKIMICKTESVETALELEFPIYLKNDVTEDDYEYLTIYKLISYDDKSRVFIGSSIDKHHSYITETTKYKLELKDSMRHSFEFLTRIENQSSESEYLSLLNELVIEIEKAR
jgi:hypothetical protein